MSLTLVSSNLSPAHCGAAKGQLNTLKMLRKYKGNMWMLNQRHDLPLHEAVQSGKYPNTLK